APATAVADRLDVTAKNVGVAIVDTFRARLSCSPQVDLHSDGPLDLQLACPTATGAGPCRSTVAFGVPRVRGRRVTMVTVTRGRRVLKRARGRNVRRLVVRRPTARAFT